MRKYVRNNGSYNTVFEFVPSENLPDGLPVSASLTFAFVGQDIVLVQKENGYWDIVGGKLESGETWADALKREALEEAGIVVDHTQIVGYVVASSSGDLTTCPFAKKNIMPISISFVQKIQEVWPDKLVKKRDIFRSEQAKEILAKRDDNYQLLEIFEFAFDYFKKQNYQYDYKFYIGSYGIGDIPATQAMVFLRGKNNKICVVRDFGESRFSLPGGGCHLGELPEMCALREVREEAQVEVRNLRLLGEVVVSISEAGKILSQTRHVRYLADYDKITTFVPRKDGFETEERKNVDISELGFINPLANETGKEIIAELKKEIL